MKESTAADLRKGTENTTATIYDPGTDGTHRKETGTDTIVASDNPLHLHKAVMRTITSMPKLPVERAQPKPRLAPLQQTQTPWTQ